MSLDDLLVSAQAGRREDREALALALYSTLRSFFRKHCRPIDAEDLVQATLVVIYREIDGFVPQHPRAFESMVISTAHRLLFTMRRSWARERFRRVDSPPLVLAHQTSASDRLDRRWRALRTAATVDELATADRRAIFSWLSDDDLRQLATVEGVAPATLRTRLHRALTRLRNLVHQTELSPRRAQPATT